MTILGCDSLSIVSDGSPTDTATLAPLPPLGTITSGNTTTDYIGEEMVYDWESSGVVAPAQATGVPKPSALWMGTAGIAALCAIRIGRRFRKPWE